MTTIYRAAEDTELFVGAHFAHTREEAESYTNNPGFGGPVVWEMVVNGSILRVDGLRELAKAAIDLGVEPPAYESYNDYGEVTYTPGNWGTLYDAWMDQGFDQEFKAIEGDGALLDALNASEYEWVSFDEPAIGDESRVSTTYRYLG